jgi:aspartate aminotransferase
MKPIRLSQRATKTPPSPIRKLAPQAKKAESEGIAVHRINIGQPDVLTPPEYFEGLERFEPKVVKYEDSLGSWALRESWSNFMQKTIDLSVSPEEIIITVGASEALIFAFMTCCDPGDEIIIFEPTYANFIGFAALAGVKLIPITCEIEDGFRLPSKDEITEVFSNRTRAILISNPNNPTGTYYTKDEMTVLIEICEENNIFLIADETYREIVFDSIEPFSVQHISKKNSRIIVIDSLSKRFSLCGARIGCLITCNKEVIKAIGNIAQARLAAPTIEQYACSYMLDRLGSEFLNTVRKTYEQRRDCLINALQKIPSIYYANPSGAFYLLARLPVKNAESFCQYMLNSFSLDRKTVFLAPGAGFYLTPNEGEDTVRLAFIIGEEGLAESVKIIKMGLISFLQSL